MTSVTILVQQSDGTFIFNETTQGQVSIYPGYEAGIVKIVLNGAAHEFPINVSVYALPRP
jgi:hypothetical protein